MQPYKKTWLT